MYNGCYEEIPSMFYCHSNRVLPGWQPSRSEYGIAHADTRMAGGVASIDSDHFAGSKSWHAGPSHGSTIGD